MSLPSGGPQAQRSLAACPPLPQPRHVWVPGGYPTGALSCSSPLEKGPWQFWDMRGLWLLPPVHEHPLCCLALQTQA